MTNGKIELSDGEEQFQDEESAYEFVEQHVWPEGPVCPHCGAADRIGRLNGCSTRIHTYKCYHCRKPFTVKIGTLFEDSHVPMHKWLQAMVLSQAGNRRINANQVSKAIGVTFKTAVAMLQRIRDAADRSKLLLLGLVIVPLLAQAGAPPLGAPCSSQLRKGLVCVKWTRAEMFADSAARCCMHTKLLKADATQMRYSYV